MTAKIKIMTIVGTRPEIIRLSSLIRKLDRHTEHTLVHTGQNADPNLKDVFFTDLGLREPDVYLDSAGTSLGETMGNILWKSEKIMREINPLAVMILGDTNSALAAIVAERLQIPVYHMEAGNRSFDLNVPEEINRRLVDHVSTFNLPYNSHSRSNLLREGIHPRFIFTTGSPMREVIEENRDKIDRSAVLERLKIKSNGYILASLHRQENVDDRRRLTILIEALDELTRSLDLPVIMSTHPRTQKMLNQYQIKEPQNVNFAEPFGFLDYCKLQQNSRIVISDSGTISEESAILGFRAVTTRDSMERPEALEAGSITMTGLEAKSIIRGVQLALEKKPSTNLPEGYDTRSFSDNVLNFVFSTVGLAGKWKGLNE